MYIYNFKDFSLLENYGTPEFAKKLSTTILSNCYKNSFQSFKQIINIKEISLIKEINIVISHIKENYHTKFRATTLDPFNGLSIEFDIPDISKINWNYLHEIILHELTHLYEFYNILLNNRKLPIYDKIKKGLINTINQDNIDIFSYFRNIIYLSLDNELNARVSQTYIYLKNLKTNDKDILEKSLEKSNAWRKMEKIISFNPKNYTNDLIKSIGETFTLILINEFNRELINNGFNYNTDLLTNKEDILNYFKIWNKKLKYKMVKEKLLKTTLTNF